MIEKMAFYKKQLDSVKKGSNILVKISNAYHLIKYEGNDSEVNTGNSYRHNRHTYISEMSLLLAKSDKERKKIREKHQQKRHKLNIYGTHLLSFNFDVEFGLFLPSSWDSDLLINFMTENGKGEIIFENNIKIITDIDLIKETIKKITRPFYYASVIEPFLESKTTKFQIPEYKKRWFKNSLKLFLDAQQKYQKIANSLNHGDFIYVGGKNEVYLLTVAKKNDCKVYMQGTYTTSTKPLFYFSNNYLSFISRRDAERIKIKGGGNYNVMKYRTFDIPSFENNRFVFPQMGRSQNCKNTIFTGEPEIITGEINEALSHFSTTDFAEFKDIVKKFAKSKNKIHPSFNSPNGKFYY